METSRGVSALDLHVILDLKANLMRRQSGIDETPLSVTFFVHAENVEVVVNEMYTSCSTHGK